VLFYKLFALRIYLYLIIHLQLLPTLKNTGSGTSTATQVFTVQSLLVICIISDLYCTHMEAYVGKEML